MCARARVRAFGIRGFDGNELAARFIVYCLARDFDWGGLIYFLNARVLIGGSECGIECP